MGVDIEKKAFGFDEPLDRSRLNTVKWEFERERLGDDGILSFGTADMDFRSPPKVLAALQGVVASGHLGYPHKSASYYDAIVGFYSRRFGWRIAPEWIRFDVGVYASMGALIDQLTVPGDEVIYQTPVHKVFREVVEYAGRVPVTVPLVQVSGQYQMDFTALRRAITDKTKMLLLCNPHNPVGRSWTHDELRQVSEICSERGVIVVSDEVYCGLIFPGKTFVPFGSVSPEASRNSITLFSASKSFNLTGLKHSIVITENPAFRAAFERALKKGDLQYGGSVFGQVASEVALRDCDDWSSELMKYVAENLVYLKEFVSASMPLVTVNSPEATYLAWLDFSNYKISPEQLQSLMEQEARVILTHGYTMGEGGSGHVRLNLATQRVVLESGLRRIAQALQAWQHNSRTSVVNPDN
ncbi:MalY/PatB family protein [Paracandidimonas soli]|uniref:cysteine-S-conjugate beta-lyase n=1 Tax=Paracandidimonas soli TaxID=1917182 RepID=A0A4R3VGK4_9BURK|nr:MalY/PatB family protein [Paracandidimonas soli]TCV02839.1 cystathionine beta-lyase [Paracandidimonas soli]